MDVILTALGLVFQADVLLTILLSSMFGIFVGAMPGLTATMATALLVPVTFFMPPVQALSAIVSATTMAIFAGDIPGTLLRIPGTPASAAYADESYMMAKKGETELNLGVNLVFSVLGGLVGVAALIFMAPSLAELAINFSSYEYFWLALLGLTCAILIATEDALKGFIALLLGLAIGTIGIDPAAGVPRFTYGNVDLLSGVSFIPVMIGVFAVSELLRNAPTINNAAHTFAQSIGNIFTGIADVFRRYWVNFLRGSILGTVIGALPGAGADIAAWVSYAVSKRASKEPEKFGTGHIEGIVDATSANNSALGGAWIPALVFGIPGDSITAIVIGVLYMKNMNPGPSVFLQNPQFIYAVFIVFIIANLLMLPIGWVAIKSAKRILSVPRNVLSPIILMFCIVGSFAITNSDYAILIMLIGGVVGWILEENGFPVAPIILGLVLGEMLEQTFMTSMIKSDGSILPFVSRPIAGILAALTLVVWVGMAWRMITDRKALPGAA